MSVASFMTRFGDLDGANRAVVCVNLSTPILIAIVWSRTLTDALHQAACLYVMGRHGEARSAR